ncbi:ABC transporter permease [Sulfitobacter pacificus]|uniref:Peptide ABC transporter permease n=1 Tax=Sulfitobacter pacificus TaxID=1499314 RepID=A0ABQ5VR71_9RHOB|nr:ABC transporter permease [Sulfitobacter pacificus]GLQ29407.1 peptide ABC transporter permease [Sulfitobacter pacificus]
MLRYTTFRILAAIPTLFLVTILVFFFIRLVPGDPAAVLVGDIQNIGRLEEVRRELGLDRSIPEQFFAWIGKIFQGDFGVSIMNQAPVLDTILDRFAVTAQVILIAVLFTTLIAVPAGMIAAWRQNRLTDNIIVVSTIAAMSVPSFWIGLTLILIFGIELGWLPAVGYVSLFEDFSRGAVYLIMPVAALVLGEVGGVLRMARASTIEIMRRDYITHARAKGLSEAAVLSRHAFPNAFAPTLTILGMIIGSLLGGAAVIETVFTLPGLGRLTIDAISSRDYPMVQGILLVVAVIYVLVNLITDLLYPLFDPRVKL